MSIESLNGKGIEYINGTQPAETNGQRIHGHINGSRLPINHLVSGGYIDVATLEEEQELNDAREGRQQDDVVAEMIADAERRAEEERRQREGVDGTLSDATEEDDAEEESENGEVDEEEDPEAVQKRIDWMMHKHAKKAERQQGLENARLARGRVR